MPASGNAQLLAGSPVERRVRENGRGLAVAVHGFHHPGHAFGLLGGKVCGFTGIPAEMIQHRFATVIHIILHELPIALEQGAEGLGVFFLILIVVARETICRICGLCGDRPG